MPNKIAKNIESTPSVAGGNNASPLIWERAWETLASANLPIALLEQIAVVVGARNPASLQRRTFSTHPMDVSLLMTAVVFEDYLQKFKFRSPTRRQIKKMELVAKNAEELEKTIELLEEPERFRLQNAHASLRQSRAEIRKLANAARSAATSVKENVSDRPLHSFKHNALNLLIAGLYPRIVIEAGGELTLWQDCATGQVNGTLPDVLELLRPYLEGILPEKMHFSTLYRALARAKNAYRS